eukprot:g55585.t1
MTLPNYPWSEDTPKGPPKAPQHPIPPHPDHHPPPIGDPVPEHTKPEHPYWEPTFWIYVANTYKLVNVASLSPVRWRGTELPIAMPKTLRTPFTSKQYLILQNNPGLWLLLYHIYSSVAALE